MGVQGLTTYLRDHRHLLAKNIQLDSKSNQSLLSSNDRSADGVIKQFPGPAATNVRVVVDGWSFIYQLYQTSRLPWAYGGEYYHFSLLIERTVESLHDVGLELFFVFDGPEEQIKFPTMISRLTATQVNNSHLFFRTSTSARSNRRFLADKRMLPSLCYKTCVSTLLRLASANPASTSIYFADREADPFMVELAGRIGAFVAAVDSDFVILNTQGYRGYIPMDELIWISDQEDELASLATSTLSINSIKIEEDDGFTPVKRARKTSKKIAAGTSRGLLPPLQYSVLILSVYTPASLAKILNITPTMLPLLSALVGNDYTQKGKDSSYQRFLFDRKTNSNQRIIHTASCLSTVLARLTRTKEKAKAPASVLELIKMSVTQMLLKPSITSSSEVDMIVDAVVESALQYAIPPSLVIPSGGNITEILWPTEFCPLHKDVEFCRLPGLIPMDEMYENETEESQEMVRTIYLRAYREGRLDRSILDIIITATSWPRIFLENPDIESAPRVYGSHLRRITYAILDEGVGIPIMKQEEDISEDEGSFDDRMSSSIRHPDGSVRTESLMGWVEDEGDDEIIDVIDEDSEEEDPLAALKGALQRLRGGMQQDGESRGGVLPTIPDLEGEESDVEPSDDGLEPRVVTEYLRKGGRITEEQVLVEGLTTLLEKLVEALHSPPGDFGHSSLPQLHRIPQTTRARPIQLEDEDTRLQVLLLVTASETEAVKTLETNWAFPVLVARWLVRNSALKETPNSSISRWTKREVGALLAAFDPESRENDISKLLEEDSSQGLSVPLAERSIQLMSGALATMEALLDLIQVLSLTDRVPFQPHLFSGILFHSEVSNISKGTSVPMADDLWAAVQEGLETSFGEDRVKRQKKISQGVVDGKKQASSKSFGTKSKGKYEALAGLDDM